MAGGRILACKTVRLHQGDEVALGQRTAGEGGAHSGGDWLVLVLHVSARRQPWGWGRQLRLPADSWQEGQLKRNDAGCSFCVQR